jgi:hypothetical protein
VLCPGPDVGLSGPRLLAAIFLFYRGNNTKIEVVNIFFAEYYMRTFD